MATLIDVRDLLALQGQLEARRISELLAMPLPRVSAMLERLEAMGKIIRLHQEADGCLSGSCKGCPEGKACLRERWTLRG